MNTIVVCGVRRNFAGDLSTSITESLAQNENVILDTTNLSEADKAELGVAGDTVGRMTLVNVLSITGMQLSIEASQALGLPDWVSELIGAGVGVVIAIVSGHLMFRYTINGVPHETPPIKPEDLGPGPRTPTAADIQQGLDNAPRDINGRPLAPDGTPLSDDMVLRWNKVTKQWVADNPKPGEIPGPTPTETPEFNPSVTADLEGSNPVHINPPEQTPPEAIITPSEDTQKPKPDIGNTGNSGRFNDPGSQPAPIKPHSKYTVKEDGFSYSDETGHQSVTQAQADKLAETRRELLGNSKKHNVAYTEAEVDGIDMSEKANSGRTSRPGSVSMPDHRELSFHPVGNGANPRDYDSELKLLEDLLTRTTDKSVGHVTLVTERDTCESCIDAIQEFVAKRPWITVEVRFLDPYPVEVGQ